MEWLIHFSHQIFSERFPLIFLKSYPTPFCDHCIQYFAIPCFRPLVIDGLFFPYFLSYNEIASSFYSEYTLGIFSEKVFGNSFLPFCIRIVRRAYCKLRKVLPFFHFCHHYPVV